MCPLTGDINAPGLYYTLVRWWPGYHERPAHLYDRSVLRRRFGDLVVQQRRRFRPRLLRPVPAGSFVRRVAGTPHYDGVIRGRDEPAIIAICGVGPVNLRSHRSVAARRAAGVTAGRDGLAHWREHAGPRWPWTEGRGSPAAPIATV